MMLLRSCARYSEIEAGRERICSKVACGKTLVGRSLGHPWVPFENCLGRHKMKSKAFSLVMDLWDPYPGGK